MRMERKGNEISEYTKYQYYKIIQYISYNKVTILLPCLKIILIYFKKRFIKMIAKVIDSTFTFMPFNGRFYPQHLNEVLSTHSKCVCAVIGSSRVLQNQLAGFTCDVLGGVRSVTAGELHRFGLCHLSSSKYSCNVTKISLLTLKASNTYHDM